MPDPIHTDDISLSDLLALLWRARTSISVATAASMALGTAATFIVQPKYESSVVLSIVSDRTGDMGSQIGGLTSQIGGLAAIAGINIGGDSRKGEAVATLQSEVLTQAYIRDKNLLPILFSDRWNSSAGQWKATKIQTPTLWKGSERFRRDVRRVSENAKSGLLTLSVTWTDPAVSAEWANDLVKRTNDYLRSKTIQETERNIAFLNQQISKTNILEIKNASFALMESELKRQMMAQGSDEYALRVIDPAFAPEKPSSPMRAVWILSAAFLGFAAASMIALSIGLFRTTKSRAT